MKNTIKLGILSLIASVLVMGCASSGVSHDAMTHKTVSTKEIHDIIKKAAEQEGWRMTEFRANSMIAEKDGVVTTVTYKNSEISTNPKNSSLEETIEDALKH